MAERGPGGGVSLSLSLSLYGSSVNGRWRAGSLAGNPGG